MKYDYPKEFQIGGLAYSISLLDSTTTDGDGKWTGDACHNICEIRIATRTNDGGHRNLGAVEEALWHEIIHTVNHVYSMSQDEDNIERMAQGLFQIFNQLGWHIIREK
jgi:hypothetical protein